MNGTMMDTTPRAWVGCLACYNAGRLVGEWVDGIEADLMDDEWKIRAGCDHQSTDPIHDEWWVMDHEGYAGLIDGECSPAEAQTVAEFIEDAEARGIDLDAFAAWQDHYGTASLDDEAVATFEESYAGDYDNEEHFAEELADDIYGLRNSDDAVARYFDYGKFARDLFMGGDYYSAPTLNGGVYVFRAI